MAIPITPTWKTRWAAAFGTPAARTKAVPLTPAKRAERSAAPPPKSAPRAAAAAVARPRTAPAGATAPWAVHRADGTVDPLQEKPSDEEAEDSDPPGAP